MKALVTGATGFVGHWLTAYLEEAGDEVVMLPSSLDIRDRDSLLSSLEDVQVDICYHLAALTHVGQSWEMPHLYYETNVVGTGNLCEALDRMEHPPTLILVSSSEVYGRPLDSKPLCEGEPARPVSPYAASKAASESVALQRYWGRGFPSMVVRAFNHTGSGQSADFVVPAFARRLIEAKRTGGHELAVGNLEPRRDIGDVRDVVAAYRAVAVKGVPGETYNVCTGKAPSMAEIVDLLTEIVGVDVVTVADPDLVRAVDVPVIVGSAAKLERVTGFHANYGLRDTLLAVVESLM